MGISVHKAVCVQFTIMKAPDTESGDVIAKNCNYSEFKQISISSHIDLFWNSALLRTRLVNLNTRVGMEEFENEANKQWRCIEYESVLMVETAFSILGKLSVFECVSSTVPPVPRISNLKFDMMKQK